MKNDKAMNDRDEVLFAFESACPRPTAKDIIEWANRYPQFAEDIRCYAAISMDVAANEGRPVEEPDERMLSRGHSRALNASFNAAQAAKVKASAKSVTPAATPMTLQQLIGASGMTAAAFADNVPILRDVVADLVGARIQPPIYGPLLKAFLRLLNIDKPTFDLGHQQTMLVGGTSHAKADARPGASPRSYEEVINDSDMTPEEKRYWLSAEED